MQPFNFLLHKTGTETETPCTHLQSRGWGGTIVADLSARALVRREAAGKRMGGLR